MPVLTLVKLHPSVRTSPHHCRQETDLPAVSFLRTILTRAATEQERSLPFPQWNRMGPSCRWMKPISSSNLRSLMTQKLKHIEGSCCERLPGKSEELLHHLLLILFRQPARVDVEPGDAVVGSLLSKLNPEGQKRHMAGKK